MIYRTTLQCYYHPGRRSAGLGARLRAPPCRFRFAYTDVSRGGGGYLTRLAFARRKLVSREKWKKKMTPTLNYCTHRLIIYQAHYTSNMREAYGPPPYYLRGR
ncbi:hypothetical protein QTP88_014440 [Uroleucon formosanum]